MNATGDDTNDVRLLQNDDEDDTGVQPGGTPVGGDEPTEEEPPEDGEKESGQSDVAPSWRVVALSSVRGESVKVVPRRNRKAQSAQPTSDDDGVMDV
jgi:hypothetical protein